ncbi:MAG: hypothetical protein IT366_03435 [Candidatus Hydrogenedentes bacterium]|nr:hypothetical protein [Candidatus Hydrogenedentota bacterium]
MRRAARVDANQGEIVAALRQIGASVQPLHTIGQGCPDLLCARGNNMYLLECKDGKKPPSKQQLTPDEANWIIGWQAPVHIVRSVEEAIAVVTS